MDNNNNHVNFNSNSNPSPNRNPNRFSWGNLFAAIFLAVGTVAGLGDGDKAFAVICIAISISIMGLQILRILMNRR